MGEPEPARYLAAWSASEPRYRLLGPSAARIPSVRPSAGRLTRSPIRHGRPWARYDRAQSPSLPNTAAAASTALTQLALAGKPSASSMAGASNAAQGSRPKGSCPRPQESTAPGTVTDHGPRSGMPASPASPAAPGV